MFGRGVAGLGEGEVGLVGGWRGDDQVRYVNTPIRERRKVTPVCTILKYEGRVFVSIDPAAVHPTSAGSGGCRLQPPLQEIHT